LTKLAKEIYPKGEVIKVFSLRFILSLFLLVISGFAVVPVTQAKLPNGGPLLGMPAVSSALVEPVPFAGSIQSKALSNEPILAVAPNGPRAPNSTLIRVPSDVPDLQSAINQINDGGIIELAAGTYYSPEGGFRISNMGKGFTIRAAPGAMVYLDGTGSRDILRLMNTDVALGRPIVFENLTFRNGLSQTDGIAGGVTLHYAQATFKNCVFQNNRGNQPTTGGGGTLVALYSTAFFLDSTWSGNSAKNYGGGLAVNEQATVYIHNSQFINNRTNLPNHLPQAAGGGLHVGNSTVRVTNTRFEGNQAGYVGGGMYARGDWTGSGANVIVMNSTFVNNQAVRDASVSYSLPTEAGALHVEDLTTTKVYNSRFVTNSAHTGGGVVTYRAYLEIYNSVFQGNRATATGAATGFGGAIMALSNDTPADGGTNRRSAYLKVEGSLIQGRYGSVTTVGQTGGGLYAAGDSNRMYGQNGVGQQGDAATNRATVIIRNTAFYDTDVQETVGAPGTGVGGGLTVDLVNLTMENSIVARADAFGVTNSSGGGMAILDQSSATITNSTFARNTSQMFGAGIFVQGSALTMTGGHLIANEISPGVSEPIWTSYGAAVFASPDTGRNLAVTGTIQNVIISSNIGLPIFDDDRTSGPINDLRYNGNQIYSTTFGDQIYTDSIAGYCCKTVAQLNSLVVSRSNGTSTDKSPNNDNVALGSAPIVGAILAVPSSVLATNASGDSAPPTTSYLVYAWSGGSATLDGSPVSDYAGLSSYTSAGAHTLSVGGTPFLATISQGITPTITAQANPAQIPQGSTATLSWSITGTFSDMAIDQGVAVTAAPDGSVQVAPTTTKTYYFYGVTQEGGAVTSVTVTVTSGSGNDYKLFLPMILKP
jgi:hypothetical protein